MLAAALDRFPALRDLRVQFAALATVVALPFYDPEWKRK